MASTNNTQTTPTSWPRPGHPLAAMQEMHYSMTKQIFRILTILIYLATTNNVMAWTKYKSIKVHQDSEGKNDVLVIGDKQFSLTNDSIFDYSYLKCSNKNTLVIDSADYSAYGSRIYAFDSKTSKDTLVIWSIEYEHSSVLHLYYLNNGNIQKMGELTPLLDCKDCETKSYPISSIKMVDDKSIIRFVFLKPVEFENQKANNTRTANAFILYDKQTFSTKMHWR